MSTHFWASCQCGAHGMQRASVPKPQGNREMRDLSCWISCSDHVSKQLRCFGSGFLSLPFTWALLLTNLNPEQPPPPLEECCFSAVGSLWQPSELIRIGSALISRRALLPSRPCCCSLRALLRGLLLSWFFQLCSSWCERHYAD